MHSQYQNIKIRMHVLVASNSLEVDTLFMVDTHGISKLKVELVSTTCPSCPTKPREEALEWILIAEGSIVRGVAVAEIGLVLCLPGGVVQITSVRVYQ